jgi:glycosyltransferase involved in cell wall biosynthesis
MELSVVLISKNQAWNIARLVESVLRGTSSIPASEIILVDSASTDDTVQLASRYPINIVRLRPTQKLSPAAGRYIGYKRTRGEFILFLDGDMELIPGWLGPAICAMRSAPDAGVMHSSCVIELPPNNASVCVTPPEGTGLNAPREVARATFVVGGAALYRRSALEHVGTFNPYLSSDEEPELYLRIRHGGYRILQLDSPIVRHFTVAQDSFSGLLGRRRRHFLRGVGQCIRYHLRSKLLWSYVRERGSWSLIAALWLGFGLGSALWTLITRDYVWVGAWTLTLCLLVGFAAIRKRSLRRTLFSLFHRVLMVEGLFRGLLTRPIPPDRYPRDEEVIKETGGPVFLPAPPVLVDDRSVHPQNAR